MYKVLRNTNPVAQLGDGFWVVAKYDDVLRVLRDPETFSSRVSEADVRGEPRPPTILFDDPPIHTRMRGLLTSAFTPRVVELQREFIQENCDQLIDAMLADTSQPVDYVAGLSYPLPVGVIANMLGVADGDLATFKRWSDAIIQNVGTTLFAPETVDLEDINREFDAYFSAHIQKIREHPEDTLLSALVHAVGENGEVLSMEDLLVVSRVLLVAGNETTTGPDHQRRARIFRPPACPRPVKGQSVAGEHVCRRGTAILPAVPGDDTADDPRRRDVWHDDSGRPPAAHSPGFSEP